MCWCVPKDICVNEERLLASQSDHMTNLGSMDEVADVCVCVYVIVYRFESHVYFRLLSFLFLDPLIRELTSASLMIVRNVFDLRQRGIMSA